MRVLVVDDETVLADTVARGLRREGMSVDVAHDGTAALERVGSTRYDVVVLDRDLPGLHGDDVCRRLLADGDGTSRVLMLTAAGDVRDRVEGLHLGADDYLVKPFAFAELVARVHALGRRATPARPPVLERAGVRLDPADRSVTRRGRLVRLSPKEYEVLHVLLSADGAFVSAEQLLERAWDEYADPFSNSMRVVVGRLRRKLGEPPVVETRVGAGYRIA